MVRKDAFWLDVWRVTSVPVLDAQGREKKFLIRSQTVCLPVQEKTLELRGSNSTLTNESNRMTDRF